MKITFCLIVCNSDAYLRQWLENYYPVADYIVIAEGATKPWMEALGWKYPNSQDNTINIIKSFPDPENKIRVYFAGKPYQEKTEQTNAYMNMVPEDTDYLWLADSDEVYFQNDVKKMRELLERNAFTYVEFDMLNFFKQYNVVAVGGHPWGYSTPVARIFKYHKGAMFTNHRPLTLFNEHGVDLKTLKPLHCDFIKTYHYSYTNERQVFEKMMYYSKVFNFDYLNNWYHPVFCQWTIENRHDIENQYSVHPTGKGAKTIMYNCIHPIKLT